MTMMTLIAALAAQALPAPGTTGDWQVILRDDFGVSRFDPGSVRRDGDIVRVVTHTEINVAEPDGTTAAAVRIAIDCVRQTFSYEVVGLYRGGALDERTIPEPSVQPLPAMSIERLVFNQLCQARQ